MTDKNWKASERNIAKRLNARRVGCTGHNTADVVNGWLSVEVKTRKRLPSWLTDALRQAHDNTQGDRLPLVILHQVGDQHRRDVVVMTLKNFEDWFGDAGHLGQRNEPVCGVLVESEG